MIHLRETVQVTPHIKSDLQVHPHTRKEQQDQGILFSKKLHKLMPDLSMGISLYFSSGN